MKTKFKVGDRVRLKEEERREFLSYDTENTAIARSVFGDNLNNIAIITELDDDYDSDSKWSLASFHNDPDLLLYCSRLELVDDTIIPTFELDEALFKI